jgi:hypothetical protein
VGGRRINACLALAVMHEVESIRAFHMRFSSVWDACV